MHCSYVWTRSCGYTYNAPLLLGRMGLMAFTAGVTLRAGHATLALRARSAIVEFLSKL